MDDMTLENKRKRLIFRSEHRGTKEMDLLLGSYARKFVPDFTAEQVAEYEVLLTHNDPDLYNWITGQEDAPDDVQGYSAFQKLLEHRFA